MVITLVFKRVILYNDGWDFRKNSHVGRERQWLAHGRVGSWFISGTCRLVTIGC